MKQQKLTMLAALALAIGVAVFASVANAAPDDAQGTVGATGQYSTAAANAVTAEGGNVTEVNVSSNQTTTKWQGFWGDVSGNLALGDGTDVFYNWSGVDFQAVYASGGNALDFTSVSDVAGTAALESKDTQWSFNSGSADSINQTMGGAGCSAGTIFTAADGVTPNNSSGNPGSWETCIGETGASVDGTVFGTGILVAGADGYNGQTVQYQLMVPVLAAGDDYYFYLEI